MRNVPDPQNGSQSHSLPDVFALSMTPDSMIAAAANVSHMIPFTFFVQ